MPWNIEVPPAHFHGFDYRTNEWTSNDDFQTLMNELEAHKVVAIDTETTGLIVHKDWPLYFSLAWGQKRATLSASMLPHFKRLFNDENRAWVMANAKFDTHMLTNMNSHPYGKLVDTCVMHSLLYEDRPHGLKEMCKHIGGWTWGDFQDQFGKITAINSPEVLMKRAETADFGLLVEYAANDSWGTLLVYNALKEQLQASPTHSLYREIPPHIETLWDLFSKIEVPYTRSLWRMERHGVKVDRARLAAARPEAQEHLKRLTQEITKYRGAAINIKSGPQLHQWLIVEKGLAPVAWNAPNKKTGKRTPKVDEPFLQYHADRGEAACKLIIEHREYTKLLTTYIDGIDKLLDKEGRIHTRYNQDVARTGRLSSANPNLQNIPRPENDHWNLRQAFIPADGYDMLDFDYGQLEMRLLAAASLEQKMIDVINSGRDIHMGNTEIVFNVPYEDVNNAKIAKEAKQKLDDYQKHCLFLRNAVKSIGFGILYGMGPDKLAATLGCTVDEAKEKIAQFLKVYDAVDKFTKEAVEETERTGYAFTVLGRRRNIPDILSNNRKLRSRAERLAVNTQIQGSAADVVKMAQIMYDALQYERDFGCRMIMQVHDELVFECPKEHSDMMIKEIRYLMQHPFCMDFPVILEADGGKGSSWGDAK